MIMIVIIPPDHKKQSVEPTGHYPFTNGNDIMAFTVSRRNDGKGYLFIR